MINSFFYIKKKRKLFSTTCLILILLFNNTINAQDYEENDIESVRSTLIDFSHIEFNLEYYQFNTNQYLLAQTGNGTLKVNENNYLNIEYNISNAWLNNSNYIVPGDFSLSYIHNIYAKNYQKTGFQGVSIKLKMVLPTGKSEYLSGGDNWIFQPQIYFGWKLKNDKMYFANRFRTSFSIAHLPNIPTLSPYVRYEAILGYENNTFWLASTIDNRFRMDNQKYNLFLKLEMGVKFNRSNGIFSSITYRMVGELYFRHYLNLGYYKTF